MRATNDDDIPEQDKDNMNNTQRRRLLTRDETIDNTLLLICSGSSETTPAGTLTNYMLLFGLNQKVEKRVAQGLQDIFFLIMEQLRS